MRLSEVRRATIVHKRGAKDDAGLVQGYLLDRGVDAEITNKSYKFEGYVDSGLIVTLGGDGTVLRGFERSLNLHPVPPVLAFNLGTVGFLAEHRREDILEVLEWLWKNDIGAPVEWRTSMEVLAGPSKPFAHDLSHAVNDLVIQREIREPMLELEVLVNGDLIGPIRVDGLIVATATGSTAYNLSSGGPILHPGSDNLVITPMCSRAPGARSIVVPKGEVKITSLGGKVAHFVDGKDCGSFKEFRVRHGEPVGLVRTPFVQPYMDSLKSKMGWSL